MPSNQVVYNYIFNHNKTHKTLVIDYGSLCNHHDSPNTKAIKDSGSKLNLHFQVRTISNVRTAKC